MCIGIDLYALLTRVVMLTRHYELQRGVVQAAELTRGQLTGFFLVTQQRSSCAVDMTAIGGTRKRSVVLGMPAFHVCRCGHSSGSVALAPGAGVLGRQS